MKLPIVLSVLIAAPAAFGFVVPSAVESARSNSLAPLGGSPNDDDAGWRTKSGGIPNPLAAIGDMFANLDDVIDDFYNKRMGNGEIFYGKRKYRPSGNVEGDYNGFGLTDKLRIDMTRERREEWLEEKRMREEIAALKREKELRQNRQ